MLEGAWYRTPIVPGGPDPTMVAKIGAAFAGPWAAIAVSVALTAVDIKDGVTDWKHAMVQAGVGMAAGAAPGIGSLAVNMVASGIDYEEGGGIGWSNRQFREGATRAVVSYAVSSTLNGALNGIGGEGFTDTALGAGLSAGISGFAMSGLTVSSSGWGSMNFGFDMDNWQEHATVGMASGIAAGISRAVTSKSSNTGSERAQYGNEQGISTSPEQWGGVTDSTSWYNNSFTVKALTGGINSMIMTAAYNVMDGKGFKNDYSSMNWNNMTFNAYDLGNFAGAQANALIKERQGYDAKTGKYDESKERSSGIAEDLLAIALESSEDADKYAKDFFHSIGKGLVTKTIDSIAGLYTPKITRKMNNLIDYDQKYGVLKKESVVSIIRDLREDENFLQAIDENKKLGEQDKLLLKAVAEDMKRYDELSAKMPDDPLKSGLQHGEVLEYINTKARLANAFELADKLTGKDMEMLQHALRQSISRNPKDGVEKNGPIVQSLVKMIKENTEVFKGRDTSHRDVYTKKEYSSLDLKDDKSILRFAQDVAYNGCLLVSTIGGIVASGVKGVPNDFGEIYLKAYTSKVSDAPKAGYVLDHLNRKGTDQNLVDKIVGGKNILDVVQIKGSGAALISNLEKECKGNAVYARLGAQYPDSNGKLYSHYILAHSHAPNILITNDMGYPRLTYPRTNVNVFNSKESKDVVTYKNISSANIIKMNINFKHYNYSK